MSTFQNHPSPPCRETAADTIRLNYNVVSNSKKTGLIMVGRVGADPYACADAAYVSLEYRVLEASSRPGAARFKAGKDDPIWRREVPDLAPGTHARRHTQYLREAVCLVQHVEEDEDRVLRDTRSFTRSLRLTGLRASLSSNSIRADGSTAGAGSRSSASAGSGSRSRASSESRSRETSEHAAAPPYPSPASLSRSI